VEHHERGAPRAWSATNLPLFILHLITRFGFCFELGLGCRELTLTTGAHHDRDVNAGPPDCEASLPMSCPAIPHVE